MRPLLFVTGHVPAYRAGALAELHEREGIEVALFGGSLAHGGEPLAGELPFPHRRAGPAELWQLARAGAYRGVVCSTGGRLALLAAWAGARAGRRPLLLWASLWAHPRSLVHALSYVPLRRLYRSADAVVTYGPHVSEYVRARGARNVHVAPQSVDNDFWSAPVDGAPRAPGWPAGAQVRFLFVGRDAPEKGARVLERAWERAALAGAALVLAGPPSGGSSDSGPVRLGALSAPELREVYAACDVLVVPSLATATFREPWGLVVNEAMNRGLAVIASDAVGAAAGGLVRHRETGLVVRSADVAALSAALAELAGDPALRARLGAAGRREIAAYSHAAWAGGFSEALSTVGLSRARSSQSDPRGHW